MALMVMPRSRSRSMESRIWLDHLAVGDGSTELDQPVGEGRFAVVDMGDDGEIADMGGISHCCGVWHPSYRGSRIGWTIFWNDSKFSLVA